MREVGLEVREDEALLARRVQGGEIGAQGTRVIRGELELEIVANILDILSDQVY